MTSNMYKIQMHKIREPQTAFNACCTAAVTSIGKGSAPLHLAMYVILHLKSVDVPSCTCAQTERIIAHTSCTSEMAAHISSTFNNVTQGCPQSKEQSFNAGSA